MVGGGGETKDMGVGLGAGGVCLALEWSSRRGRRRAMATRWERKALAAGGCGGDMMGGARESERCSGAARWVAGGCACDARACTNERRHEGGWRLAYCAYSRRAAAVGGAARAAQHDVTQRTRVAAAATAATGYRDVQFSARCKLLRRACVFLAERGAAGRVCAARL